MCTVHTVYIYTYVHIWLSSFHNSIPFNRNHLSNWGYQSSGDAFKLPIAHLYMSSHMWYNFKILSYTHAGSFTITRMNHIVGACSSGFSPTISNSPNHHFHGWYVYHPRQLRWGQKGLHDWRDPGCDSCHQVTISWSLPTIPLMTCGKRKGLLNIPYIEVFHGFNDG